MTSPAGRDSKPDPRDPDYSRKGVFVYHNCWRCRSGDAAIRLRGHHKGMRELGYLHRSLKPLAEAPIDLAESLEGDLFANECEGMCGV
jgi:hypothetical protein